MIYVREIKSSMGGKVGAVLAGAVLLVILGVFLAFGFILLLGLAAAGLLIGIAAALHRRITGRRPPPLDTSGSRKGLDPALEVKPPPILREGDHKR